MYKNMKYKVMEMKYKVMEVPCNYVTSWSLSREICLLCKRLVIELLWFSDLQSSVV